ncbi:MAG: helix-turn-helix transcriptional regulator [Bryobacteraceae bacterium]|jgi:AraC-type DNA-binding domain-containing proteins|nr:helix-turn-helix transcriptional regulator [Bryobacteraceae bacterium]
MLLDDCTFRRLHAARDFLALNAGRARSLQEAAAVAGMSPFHFIRQFAALFGSTPHQFQMQRRIDRAKRLLASREMSVTEVCLEVGMSSLGSFSTLFHDRVGMTPSDFQRRAKAMVQVPGQLPVQLFPGCFSLMALLPPDAFLASNSAIFKKSGPALRA